MSNKYKYTKRPKRPAGNKLYLPLTCQPRIAVRHPELQIWQAMGVKVRDDAMAGIGNSWR